MTERMVTCPVCQGSTTRIDFGTRLPIRCDRCKGSGTIPDRRKEDPALHEDCVSVAVHNVVMDRLQSDFDAISTKLTEARSEATVERNKRQSYERRLADKEIYAINLKAELAKYEAPLTRDQVNALLRDARFELLTSKGWETVDAAIRKVRHEG